MKIPSRKMRDLLLPLFFLAVPVASIVLGIRHLGRGPNLRWPYVSSSLSQSAIALKPSVFWLKGGTKNPGKNPPLKDDSRKSVLIQESEVEANLESEVSQNGRQEEGEYEEDSLVDRNLASTLSEKVACEGLEYAGKGPAQTTLTASEWTLIMGQFHQVKSDLRSWLKRNRLKIPAETADLMELQINEVKIQRPPVHDELDLTWRGIGVWTQNGEDVPVIKLGNGFVDLFFRHPKRARFELTRLVAQSWAPCELQKSQADPVWDGLLKCLGVVEESRCAVGTYSDAGWAVSSSLAALIASAECAIPALKDPGYSRCLDEFRLKSNEVAEGIRVVAGEGIR